MADASVKYVVNGNLKAMRDLADNRSIHGTSASGMAADARSAAAAPGWTGVGADYAAWLRDLWEDPTNPDVAITDRAPERAYLVVINRQTVLKPEGTVGGTAGPTPHPLMLAPTTRRHQCPHWWHQCPHRQQCQGVWT